jgi:hypothetical protein
MNKIVLLLALFVIAVLVYKLWIPKSTPKVSPTQANLYFFYTDWCGWSKKAMPEWKDLETTVSKTPYFGGIKVNLVRVNAETEQAKAESYGVDAYPTIKLETSSDVIDFTKRPTHEGLLQYLRQSLGKESSSL